MTKVRGLCLASTATQKGDLPALASSTDTSRKSENFTGRSDKTPVLTQNLPDEQRSLYVRCFTLAVEAFLLHFSGTWLAAQAGYPRTVSPCGSTPVRQQWLVGQQGALAHIHCSTNVPKVKERRLRAVAIPPRGWKPGDSLPRMLNRKQPIYRSEAIEATMRTEGIETRSAEAMGAINRPLPFVFLPLRLAR